MQVRILDKMFQFIATQLVRVQLNLQGLGKAVKVLTLLSSGRSGRFTKDLRAVLLKESTSTFLNSSKYFLSSSDRARLRG